MITLFRLYLKLEDYLKDNNIKSEDLISDNNIDMYYIKIYKQINLDNFIKKYNFKKLKDNLYYNNKYYLYATADYILLFETNYKVITNNEIEYKHNKRNFILYQNKLYFAYQYFDIFICKDEYDYLTDYEKIQTYFMIYYIAKHNNRYYIIDELEDNLAVKGPELKSYEFKNYILLITQDNEKIIIKK